MIYETINEIVERTKLPKSWWYRQTMKSGPDSVPRIRAGKYLLFVPQKVDDWLQKQQAGGCDEKN